MINEDPCRVIMDNLTEVWTDLEIKPTDPTLSVSGIIQYVLNVLYCNS